MEIIPLGDSALIVRVRDRFEDAPEKTLDTVLRAFGQLQNAAIPGIIELAPAYTSVAVFFDPIVVAKAAKTPANVFDSLATRIRAAVAARADPGRDVPAVRLLATPPLGERRGPGALVRLVRAALSLAPGLAAL